MLDYLTGSHAPVIESINDITPELSEALSSIFSSREIKVHESEIGNINSSLVEEWVRRNRKELINVSDDKGDGYTTYRLVDGGLLIWIGPTTGLAYV